MSESNSNKKHNNAQNYLLRETAFFTIHHTQDTELKVFPSSDIKSTAQGEVCTPKEQAEFSQVIKDIEKQLGIL